MSQLAPTQDPYQAELSHHRRKEVMAVVLFVLICLLSSAAFAQDRSITIKDASKFFDVTVKAADCDEHACTGEASFSFYKKGQSTPYQVIEMTETYLELRPDSSKPPRYRDQGAFYLEDFNFDGMEDVAICNGRNASYGGMSYDIYLSKRGAGKFVLSEGLTEIADKLYSIKVNKKTRLLETFDKSGCCYHVTTRYKVVGDRPVKVFEELEDATNFNNNKVKVTTKALVGGRWRTNVRYEKRDN